MYKYITNIDSPNYTPAHLVAATYGRARNISSITIHWWGLPEWNQKFVPVVDYLCDRNRPSRTSAHEVIEAGRVACIIDHANAAWHCGNAQGNATSIALELNPRMSEGDYMTAAERIRDIRRMHGWDLPLVKHNYWKATQCPGYYDIARLDHLAKTINFGDSSDQVLETPSTTPSVLESEMHNLIYIKVGEGQFVEAMSNGYFKKILTQNTKQTEMDLGNLPRDAQAKWVSNEYWDGLVTAANLTPKA